MFLRPIFKQLLSAQNTKLLPRMLTSISSVTASTDATVVTEKANSKYTEYYWKPIDVYQRLESRCELKYEHPSDHPKILIRRMEKSFITEILKIQKSDKPVTVDWLKGIYEDAIRIYGNDEISPALIVDILTFFLAQYDLDWIRQSIIPHVPEATDQLDLLSTRVLCSCVVAYSNQLELTPAVEKFVTQMYEDFLKQSKFDSMAFYFYSSLLLNMLKVVCRTPSWKRLGLTTLEDKSATLGNLADVVLERAVSDHDFDTAFTLFGRGTEDKGRLLFERRSRTKFDSCFDSIVSNLPPSRLPEFLPIVQDIELEISENSASLLLSQWNKMLKSANCEEEGTITQLDDSGHCLACSNKLEQESLTPSEVQNLKEMFYEKSIIESGMYKLVEPQSLQKFIKWLSRRKPYDLVIDGLNAFHCHFLSHTKVGYNIRQAMSQQLHDIVGPNDRVLVVLRKHARKWIPSDFARRVDVYFIANDEMDDVYTLYAALSSGPQCYLLSSDEYADHMQAVFNQPDKSLYYSFCRWQRMRTLLRSTDCLTLRGINKYDNMDVYGRGVPTFTKPLETTVRAQLHHNHWHVPIYNELITLGRPRYSYTQQWLCLPAAVSPQ